MTSGIGFQPVISGIGFQPVNVTVTLKYFRGAKGDTQVLSRSERRHLATFAERKATLGYFRGAKGDTTFAERKATLSFFDLL